MPELIPPTVSDKTLFNQMAQFYLYDFSAVNNWPIGSDGRYPDLPCFDEMWTDDHRFPFIIYVDKEPAGFLLVQQSAADEFNIEQFFVLRKFRRSGVGMLAAHTVFRTFRGDWLVEQLAANTGAQIFWRRVISEFTDGVFQEVGTDDPMQSFTS